MNGPVKVWSIPIRLFHWSLVGAVATAWLSADELGSLHEYAGYAAVSLVGLRIIPGVLGDHYARFSQFVQSPQRTLGYAREVLRHRDRRHMGHNPLGAAMVLFLLGLLATVALTGWMQTTDTYWGVEWVEETHEVLVNILLIAIALHIAGVAHASWRHRENLPLAMITGWKRAPAENEVA